MRKKPSWADRNAAIQRARQLRREPTSPEYRLWQFLKGRPDGLKFRRQHPLPPYILDFYCAARRLVIEVDGAHHGMGDHPARDAQRDAWMSRQGFRVVRFAAKDVMSDVEAVVEAILREAQR